MSGEYGPNTAHVRALLGSLARLNEESWGEALALFRRPRKSFFLVIADLIRWQGAWRTVRKAGRSEAKEAAMRTVRSLGFDDVHDMRPYDRMTMIVSAVFALVVRDRISAQQFSTLYNPFRAVIPLQALESPPEI
ncbi:MAG: hypothetical protein ACJ8DC_03885 [Gemmatimonadales bacterium]